MSWPLVSISDFCRTGSGGTPSRKKPEFYNGNIPWVKSGDLREKTVTEATEYISNLGVQKSSAKIVPRGAILVAMYGATVGRMAMLGIDAATNQAVCSIIPDEDKALPKYVYYALLAKVPDFLRDAVGGAQPNISQGKIKDTRIPLPPLEEQKRIATILDKADAIRRKRQQAIQLVDRFLRAMFLDMFGDPVINPNGWEVKRLKELSTKISSGSTPKGGSKVYVDKGITFFRSQNIWKNDIRLDDVAFIDEKTHRALRKSSLKHKDILMTKTGRFNTENSSLGRAALFLGEDGAANINGHVYLIRLKEKVLHEFVVFVLTSNEYREHIRNVCVGGIDKRQLNKEHIEEFPIICPPDDLQIEFLKKLRIIQSMRNKAVLGLKESYPLFDCLSKKALSQQL